ncbi:MAG: D-alanyl-D-alanine dipeptidase [Archangium sp.]|nr:D-alanyl-D-alanine dipeptidase [Archangium sp.]
MTAFGALLALVVSATPEPLVEVVSVIPEAVVDLRYATPDNFMKRQVYPAGARCLLVRGVAERLKRASDALRAQGFRLKLYDCYRPHSVQWALWKVMPKPGYVADPRTGSNHNRGTAIDLTLVRLDGSAVEMPSGYDEFSPSAHHGFAGGTEASRKHREVLRAAMERAGFTRNRMEWWHYDAPSPRSFPLRDEPFVAPAK